MPHTTSKDGTRIAYERGGEGPALLILGGSLADHRFYAPLAAELARHFTVHNLDRRGRGGSGDTPPYAVEREVEDVAALVAAAGGKAYAYGHSAGSALALRAAAAGVGVTRLVLADPPFTAPGGDDEAARDAHAEQLRHVTELVATGRSADAVRFFLGDQGLPPDVLDEMLASPGAQAMVACARTLPYDYAVLGDGLVPADIAARVAVPTLVVAGEQEPAAAEALVAALPHGRFRSARAPAHELAPVEIAALATPFLAAAGQL